MLKLQGGYIYKGNIMKKLFLIILGLSWELMVCGKGMDLNKTLIVHNQTDKPFEVTVIGKNKNGTELSSSSGRVEASATKTLSITENADWLTLTSSIIGQPDKRYFIKIIELGHPNSTSPLSELRGSSSAFSRNGSFQYEMGIDKNIQQIKLVISTEITSPAYWTAPGIN